MRIIMSLWDLDTRCSKYHKLETATGVEAWHWAYKTLVSGPRYAYLIQQPATSSIDGVRNLFMSTSLTRLRLCTAEAQRIC